MRPYPILIMLSDVKPFGGAEHSIAYLARHLDRSIFSPHVLVPREGLIVDSLREAGIPVHVMPLVRARDIVNFPDFLALLREHRIRLVNAHGVRGGFFCGLARMILPIRVVVCERNLQSWRSQALPRAIDRFIARHNDFRIGVSQSIVDDMVGAGVITRDRTRAIAGGVDMKRLAVTPARRDAARRRFGVTDGELAVVTAGRLHRMKGFIDLVNAAPRIVERVPNARIIVAGEGEERETLEKRIAELNVGHAIRLIGFVRDMPELLAAADLFVLPSVELVNTPREGTPMSIQEAQAAGLAVVTTRVSGNAEIIRDGFNGRVVEPQNPSQLADAIVEVLTSPGRGQMGENGRRVVAERYSSEYVISAYRDIFLSLLEPARDLTPARAAR
ncbi:MAG TPA: glycosyltransferase [Candidatus Krumholzibacteria bacterium]